MHFVIRSNVICSCSYAVGKYYYYNSASDIMLVKCYKLLMS